MLVLTLCIHALSFSTDYIHTENTMLPGKQSNLILRGKANITDTCMCHSLDIFRSSSSRSSWMLKYSIGWRAQIAQIEKSTWTQTMSSSSSSGKMTFSYRWLDWLVSFPQVYSDGVWPLGMVFGKALLVVKICMTLKCCHDQIPHKGIKLQSFQPVAWRWYTARLKSEAGKAWASDVHRWRC